MTSQNPDSHVAPLHGDKLPGIAHHDAGSNEIAAAEVVSDVPCRKGRQGAALRRGSEIKRVRGHETRRKLIELHVFDGMRLKECSRAMGLSYGRVLAVWHGIVEDVHGSKGAPEDHLRAVRAYLDRHYRRVMEGAQGLLGEAAAYGAVVVAAGKALADLHGVNKEQPAPMTGTLEDVGREVRTVSPLLLQRMEQITQLGVAKDAASTATKSDSGHAVDGVPVDGAVGSPSVAPDAVSPLLRVIVTEGMVRRVMREGEKAVKRVQMDGAEVGPDWRPAERIDK